MEAKHPPTYDCTVRNRPFLAPFALEDHYRGSSAHPNCWRCGRGFKDTPASEEVGAQYLYRISEWMDGLALEKLGGLKPTVVDRFDKWIQAHPYGIDNERTPNANLPHRMPNDAQARAAVQYHEELEEQIREQGRLPAKEAARWIAGDKSVGRGHIRLPPSSREEDWRQEEETQSQLVTARQRPFDDREKRKQPEKEEGKLRTEVEGGDYGTVDTDEEADDEEERKGQEEEEMGKRGEDGSKRKRAEDTILGFQDWDSSGSYSQRRNSFLSSVV